MSATVRHLLVVLTVALGTLTACSDEVEKTPIPDGVVVHIDQSRIQRNGRLLFLRVENGTKQPITIESFVLTSPRFTDVRWSGDETIGATYETDLEFTMPTGRCGTAIDARVTFTYRSGDSGLRQSTTKADDRYGNAADFADRDCAESTLEDAAKLTVGTPTTRGTGRDAVLDVPVTLTPTSTRKDVRFAGFDDTVLFRQAPGSPTDVDVPLGPADTPTELHMLVVPARCDPHALAEDKVGRLFPVKVLADDVSADASFFLPLTGPQRLAFFDYFRATCGLS